MNELLTSPFTTAPGEQDWPDDLATLFAVDGCAEASSAPSVLDEVYTGIHRAIDDAISAIVPSGPFPATLIKQQNERITHRLSELETMSSSANGQTAAAGLFGVDFENLLRDAVQSLPHQTPEEDSMNIDPNTLPSNHSTPNRRSRQRSSSHQDSPSATPIQLRRVLPKTKAPSSQAGLPGGSDLAGPRVVSLTLQSNPRLAYKMLQIAEAEARERLQEIADKLHARNPHAAWNNHADGLAFPSSLDGPGFLLMLPKLALAIENNVFGEQHYRIKKRIALAQFSFAYTLAQNNPQTFLSWCGTQNVSRSMRPRGGLKSRVLHQFVDLMFPSKSCGGDSTGGGKQKGIGKIQTWRKSGKHWAALIERFGYGILLLIPPGVSDEDLRVAHSDEMAEIMEALDKCRPRFEDALAEANQLVRAHFLAAGDDAAASLSQTFLADDQPDWSDLLT